MKTRVETGIDVFVEEIKKRGKVTFSEAERIFGISEEQVEEWAKLLAEHKEDVGIEVHYPTFGEPEIVATAIQKSSEIKEKIEKLEKKGEDLEAVLEKYSGELPKKEAVEKIPAEKSPALKKPGIFSGLFKKKELERGDVPHVIGDLHKLEEELGEAEKTEKTLDELVERAKEIEAQARGLDEREKKIIEESQSVQKTLAKIKRDMEMLLPELQKKLHVIEKNRLSPELVNEIKKTIRHVSEEIADIEGFARKVESQKSKKKLAMLLKKVTQEKRASPKAKKKTIIKNEKTKAPRKQKRKN